jgi:hypothetical protein
MADRFTASIRPYLLAGVLCFVRAARTGEGVVRIALIGSLATDKRNPKDADLLITIRDGTDLAPLAALGRKLQGHAQQRNRGGEVFLCAEEGVYLGRTCPWKDCRPFVRLRCDAQHCGRTSTTISRPSPYPLRSSPRRRSNSGRSWSRAYLCPLRRSAPLTGRRTDFSDHGGVSTFRIGEVQPGWGAPYTPGSRCP